MYKTIALSMLFIFLSVSTEAQDIKLFKSFGVDNPMSYQFVRTIAQDKHGFMWFGSQEGLRRFDGYNYLTFSHDIEQPNSLSSNVVSRILFDKSNNLWVGTRGGGINLYREKKQDFLRFSTKTKHTSITNDSINALLEDGKGQLWVGTDKGLNILKNDQGDWRVTHIFQELGEPDSLSHNTVHALANVNDKIWVGTNGGGISVYDLNGNFVKNIKLGEHGKSSYLNKFVNSIYTDADGNVWIGTVDQGLIKYRLETATYEHYQYDDQDQFSVASNTIETIYQDSNGSIWIATDKGVLIYNNVKDEFYRYNYSATNPYSLSNDFVLTFFEDKDRLMWIGTYTGVNRWDPNMTTFSQYSIETHPELKNNNITSFTQLDEKKVIFSTYSGGIYQLSQLDNQLKRVDLNNYFADLRVMVLHVEHDILWVGTRNSGLFKVNLSTKNVESFKHDASNPFSLSANSITDIVRDKKGDLWVSTFHKGLNRMKKDGSFDRFVKNDQESHLGPSSDHILQLLEDDSGDIWIATYGGGINRLYTDTNRFIHINHGDKPDSLSSDLSWFMAFDSNKNLWVATQAAGLNVLSYKNRLAENYSFKHIDTQEGMKSHTVYAMIEGPNGNMWMSTNKGISKYLVATNSFKHFDLSHGLVDLEYNHGAIFQGADNLIYFGAGKGFVTIDPENKNEAIKAPSVRLTGVLNLNEYMVFDTNVVDLTKLELHHTDQLVSFEYVGLNYANPFSVQYKYRLLGFEDEWIDAGTTKRATYTNLPQGSYVLQIIAGNSDNVWSEPFELKVVMNPAPWNTWWAYIIYATLVAVLILIYTRLVNRKLLIEQQQKAFLKQQVEEKTEEFQSKNIELEYANKQLEKAATVDKVTGVKSRRYLDIYIEQASQLMNQIHQNLIPVQRSILPRLYVLMVQIKQPKDVTNSQLINLTDLLLYSRNSNDTVIRWSEDTFTVIGYEKDNNAGELASRLSSRMANIFKQSSPVNIVYSFYPFNREQPLDLSWDQVSVMIELALNIIDKSDDIDWLGLCEPKEQPFDYLSVLKIDNLKQLKSTIVIKHN